MIEPTPLGWERGSVGSKRCKRVDEDQLEAGFYAKCRTGHCWHDRTVSRQSSADALVKLFDDHFPFVGLTLGEPRRDHRVLDGFQMTTLSMRTLLSWTWMTSPLWDEKRARHSRPAPMAHTSSLRLVYRELTVRVIIFTAGSMHEQYHCAALAKKQEYSTTLLPRGS